MFLKIRSVIRFYSAHDHEYEIEDPLWNSRKILERLTQKADTVAVPKGWILWMKILYYVKDVQLKVRTWYQNQWSFAFFFMLLWYWRMHIFIASWQCIWKQNRQVPVMRYICIFRATCRKDQRKMDRISWGNNSCPLFSILRWYTNLNLSCAYNRSFYVMDNFQTCYNLSRQLLSLS